MARVDPQVIVRLPADLKVWLKAQAEENRRSQNAEIVHRLLQSQAKEQEKAA